MMDTWGMIWLLLQVVCWVIIGVLVAFIMLVMLLYIGGAVFKGWQAVRKR